MNPQFDFTNRVVSLENLGAMCKRVSGMCHRFEVAHVGKSSVRVQYSNPDEYGNPEPVLAVLPCYPQHNGTAVVLDPVRFVGCTGKNEEAWQAFEQLWECPPLFRSLKDRAMNGITVTGFETWETEYEILVARHPEFAVSSTWDKGGCIQTWHCEGREFSSYQEAQDWAVSEIKILERRK